MWNRADQRRSGFPGVVAGVLLALAGTAGAAPDPLQSQPPEPPSAGGDPALASLMVLEVVVNNTDTHELLTVQHLADGGFAAKAADLRHLRLKLDPALASDAMVPLRDLAGVTVRYDEAGQSLTLQAPDAMLESYQVELGGEPPKTDLDTVQQFTSAILNYGVYDTQVGGKNSLSGNVEALLTNRFGIFSTTGLYNGNAMPGTAKGVRLDSRWQYIDAERVRSYTLGDFVSNALSWSNSVRLAGFQIASAFDQRSDLVTAALPQFSGSAALPSTLDLYVNQQRIFSGEVPSGPYQLRSLPYVSGGDVTLVATDTLGRQVTTTQAYYYDARRLRQGLLEYSLDVGAPRLNYGMKSSDYDDTVFASGSLRYGLTNATTLEGHVESSADGLANLGAGVVQAIGGYGTVTAALAGSRYKGYSGGLASLTLEGVVGGVRFYAGTQRTLDDYFDLARVSQFRQPHLAPPTADGEAADFLTTAQASAIDRVGFSFKPWFDDTSVSLSYNRIKYDGGTMRTANLSLSRSITRRVSLFANAYSDLGAKGDRGVLLSVNVDFGHDINAEASVSHSDGRTGFTQQVTGLSGQRQGDLGWGLSNTFYDDAPDQRGGYLSYRAPQALLRAEAYQYGDSTRTQLSAEGSLVAAGGGVFAANRIGNAYAIVTNAGPDAEVMQGGVRMGHTNDGGRALLPDITPYYEQHIYIDPATLPDGWEPAATERVAVAGYRQGAIVDFGAALVHGAVLVLRGKDGKPIAPGYTVHLDGGSEDAVLGYDGQVYVQGLAAHNRVRVDLGSAGSCTAYFDYDAKGPAQPTIGPLTCQ